MFQYLSYCTINEIEMYDCCFSTSKWLDSLSRTDCFWKLCLVIYRDQNESSVLSIISILKIYAGLEMIMDNLPNVAPVYCYFEVLSNIYWKYEISLNINVWLDLIDRLSRNIAIAI